MVFAYFRLLLKINSAKIILVQSKYIFKVHATLDLINNTLNLFASILDCSFYRCCSSNYRDICSDSWRKSDNWMGINQEKKIPWTIVQNRKKAKRLRAITIYMETACNKKSRNGQCARFFLSGAPILFSPTVCICIL